MANAAMLGWILLISYFVRIYLVKRFETKQRVGYKYVEGDIQWDGRATIVYPSICCLAGFFAGMFGVGKLEFVQWVVRYKCLHGSHHRIRFF